MLRLVIDTNIWISALWGSNSAILLLKAWQGDRFELVCSNLLIDELDQVWRRPRFKKRIQAAEAALLLKQIRLRGYFVKPISIPPNCRDPKDHPVLAVAIDGKANAIVSGDDDLLVPEIKQAMKAFGVEIWRLNDFHANL